MTSTTSYRRLGAACAAALVVLVAARVSADGHGGRRSHGNGTVRVDSNRPRTAFECDLPGGADWFGSTDRCLQELCAGENVTNEHVRDREGRIRRNPCYGRDPFELQR